MKEPNELTPIHKEVFNNLTEELTVEEELALEKSLEDIEPLTTSEYINLLIEIKDDDDDVDDDVDEIS